MEKIEEVRVPKIWNYAYSIEDNKMYIAEFRVSSAPEKEGCVMDISWEGNKELGSVCDTTKRHWFNISPEQTRILWMKRDNKTLQKEFKKCKQNFENTDFKHCMKMYENGGCDLTRNWSVRFLSHHDFEIINQIERVNDSRFTKECGGSYQTVGDRLSFTQKDRPEEFKNEWDTYEPEESSSNKLKVVHS